MSNLHAFGEGVSLERDTRLLVRLAFFHGKRYRQSDKPMCSDMIASMREGPPSMLIDAFIKRSILRLVEGCGYVVIKRSAFEAQQGVSPPQLALCVPAAIPAEAISAGVESQQSSNQSQELSESSKQEAELMRIAKSVVETQVEGDIVDCGLGVARNLEIFAEVFVKLGDFSRNLRLLDTTVDPSHSAARVLPLWGGHGERLHRSETLAAVMVSQDDLKPFSGSLYDKGYPESQIVSEFIMSDRQIRRCIPEKIAVLLLSGDCYQTNVVSWGLLLPAVSRNGIVIIDRDPFCPRMGQLAPLIEEAMPDFRFKKVCESLWIGAV